MNIDNDNKLTPDDRVSFRTLMQIVRLLDESLMAEDFHRDVEGRVMCEITASTCIKTVCNKCMIKKHYSLGARSAMKNVYENSVTNVYRQKQKNAKGE